MTIQRVRDAYRTYAPQPPYVIQRKAGATLLVIGVIGLLAPATQQLLELPFPLELLLFAINAVVGVALLLTQRLTLIKPLLFAALMAFVFTALGYTFALGVNTATGIYLVEAWFVMDLISRVKADLEKAGQQRGAGAQVNGHA